MKRFFKTMAFTLLGLVLSSNLWAAEKTLIIDGSKLTSTATASATDYTYGDFTITMSDGAKQQASSGDNKFTGTTHAILIGKSGKYIYNKTPFGKITKFEIYANKGASANVSVGVLFSTTAISAYATGTNTYTATLSTLDNVYDCSSKIPEGAKYFWYQVTNAYNSQVMFRITYEEGDTPSPIEPEGSSYTITFTTGSGDGTSASTSTACSTVVSDGSDYLSGNLATATKVYYSGGSGLKLGASSDAGTIKMNLSTAGQVTPTSIVVNAKLYNSGKATTLKVNGSATQNLAADFADYTFNITSKITYIELETSKYAWIKSVTVNYEAADPTQPSLSVSPEEIDFGTVEQNAAVPAGQDVEVTFANLTTNDVTASITGDFNISKSGSFTSGDKITVTPKSTATIGTIEGTLTVKATTDDITKTVPVTMTVAAPEVGVSFEKATTAYTDWEFTNFESQQTHSDVKAHTGAYFGTTGSKASGSMVTKAKIAKPGTLQFFISKQSTNTNSSSWKVSVSTDNSEWTQVGEAIDATSMTKGTWTEVNADLTAYSNVYVKIEYAGSTATRCIDDVVFIAPQSYNVTLATSPTSVGTVTAKVNNVVIGEQVEEGQTVTLSAVPNDAHAYRFKEWQSDDVTITDNAFDMPGKAVSITAVFEPLYAVSLTTAGEGSGTATINGGAGPIYVSASDEITLVAENAAGSEFGGWTASNENIIFDNASSASTTASAGAAGTITATFGVSALLPLDAPTLSAPTNVTYNSVTLNWQELANAEGGYNVEIWLDDEMVAFESGIGENYWTSDPILQANTTYTYTVQGVGDGTTYAEENNPKAQSTVTTADYPAVVLTLSENGTPSTKDGKLNTAITLPTESTQACDGKVFMGWSETAIDGEVAKEQVTLLEATYTFDNPSVLEKTIYAVYAAVVSEGQDSYQKATSLAAGNKVIWASEDNSKPNEGVTGYNGTKDATVSTTASDWMIFTVDAGSAQGTFKFKNGTNYIAAASSSFKVTTTASDFTLNESSQAIWTSGSDKYALMKNGEYYRCYKTTSSYTKFYVWKIVSGEKTYGKYCTTCEAAVAAPIFGLAEGNYNVAQTLTLTAAEGDIYYTINDGTETKYTTAIALNNRGTYEISAYAKVDDRTSETITKTYTLSWPYTLDELAASDVADGTTVEVTFENKEITNFYTNSQGKRYGIYVNVQKGGKDVEIYCNKAEHSDSWEVGGKVSSTQAISGTWTYYSGGQQWEFCPNNWDNISYTAPAKIESLKITGDVTNKNYTAGQKLDFTGLTVTGVYSDATEEDVTEDVVWTEVTLEENQTEATATAKLNSIKTGSQDVSESKTITGLTVGAKVELSKIEITTEATKKDFFVGRNNFNHEGIVVTATYSNGSTSNVTNACDFSTPTLENKGQETVTITYSEGEGQDKKEVTTSYTINVKYMNLSELVAEDVPTNTSVKVAFSDVEITGFYKNSSDKRAGVYVNVIGKNGSNIELYSGGTPSETLNGWQEGGKLASKSDNITGTWKYYDGGSVWEIDFGNAYAWSTNIEYTAPEIYPTEISMSIPTATVKQSKSLDLEANFTPANATVLNNLEWSSDNNQVTVAPSQDKKSAKVTIDPDATVGTATITVKVDDKDGNELSATCVITIQEYAVPRYGLYSGAIEAGDYIFKADGKYYFMNNTVSSSRLTNVANADNPNIVNNVITTDAEAYVWHIAKSGDYWTIQNLANNKYAAGTGTKNQAQLLDACTDNMAKWTITYDEENEVYTFENFGRSQASSDSNNKYLRNNDNNGWACYASSTGNTITLYKAGFTPAAALQSIEIKGDLEITEYFQGKSVTYDGLTVEGTYSDGDKKTITEGIVWSANPAKFTETGDNISVTITATVQTKNGEITDDANFTVKVVESQKVNYGLVTNVNTLYDGASIILGAVFGTDATPIYAVNQGFDTKYLAAYRSNTEGSDLEYADEVMKTAYASEITLKKVEGGWKLLGEDGKYINGAGDLSQTTDVAEATVWTISIEDGVTKIASGSNIIYYNTSSPRFKTYTNAQQEIGIYMKNLLPVRTGLTIGQYTTYCEPYAVVAGSYSGATFWNIADKTYMSDNQRLYSITIEQHLGDLEAGVPYIMLPEATQLTGVKYGEAIANPVEEGNNGLYGTFVDYAFDVYETIARDAQQLYVISDGTLYLCGTGCGVYANRAYIKSNMINYVAPSGAPRRTIGRPNDTPTMLNGLFGNQAGKAQKALIDGHIYILRDNKMYNAQGLFVK